jgi:hypothetical protein
MLLITACTILTPFFFAFVTALQKIYFSTQTSAMQRSLLPLFSLLAVATAQSASFEPDSFIYPGDGIDFKGCMRDLDAADNIIRDGGVRQNEFLGFIQRYASRKCLTNDALSLKQFAAFNALSCVCASLEGQDATCCLGENGQLDTGGALSQSARTQPQVQFLTYACITIDNTLPDTACNLEDSGRGTPPPAAIGDTIGSRPKAIENDDDDDSVWDWLKWLLLALLLLLLLCCCCCCTIRRKRIMAIAEEEEEQRLAALAAEKEVDVEQQTEMVDGPSDAGDQESFVNNEEEEDHGDRGVSYGEEDEEFEVANNEAASYPDDDVMVAGAAGGTNNADDDSEDGNKRRGAHNLPEDEDEKNRRIGGYGQLPPDDDPDPGANNLRPFDPRDSEDDPDWDQADRDINFPRAPPDDYSAGYDHDDIDGGVYMPERERQAPAEYVQPHWERLKKETPEEVDSRKRRIQSGLGEAEVWNKLDEDSESEDKDRPSNDLFDWVVESALGVLDKSDDAAHVIDDEGH